MPIGSSTAREYKMEGPLEGSKGYNLEKHKRKFLLYDTSCKSKRVL